MSKSNVNSTLHQPPPIDSSCAPIEHTLSLTPFLPIRVVTEDHDCFTNTYPSWLPPQGRSLWGGILIGAAISAAQQTVGTNFFIHHMSCTFRAAPDAAKPLYYRVARTSDRRSGATREVKVEQSGVVFFSAECGFSLVAEDASAAVTHQASPPLRLKGQVVEAPPTPKVADGNEKAFTEQIVLPGFLTWKGANTTKEDVDPFIWRNYPPVPEPTWTSSPSDSNVLYSWVRSRGNMSDSRANHLAVLGCLSDAWVLLQLPEMMKTPSATLGGGLKNGNTNNSIPFMTTLNHTIWFHNPQNVRLDDWLLVRKSSSWVGQGRCLVEQQFWDRQGALVATCVQEGAVMRKQPRVEKSGQSKI
ncbi:hypothetical protein PG987_005096 [Apiospora arundinis]